MQALAGTPYDVRNAQHEAQLRQLWAALRPDTPLPHRTGRHWGTIGFQGACMRAVCLQ